MKLAVMQPYFFPYIGYFQLIKAVDKFIILDDVNYINRGWINRNRILVNKKEHVFTIPLQQVSQNKLIKDLLLDDDPKWKGKLLKTIEFSYKKAPFFMEIFKLLKTIITFEEKLVSKYIYNSLTNIDAYLNITTPIVKSSVIYQNAHLKGEQRILDICKQEKATHYINPIGGMELYKKDNFEKCGVTLSFLQSHNIEYVQFHDQFIPNLSIIDVIMFNSKNTVKDLLDEFELV